MTAEDLERLQGWLPAMPESPTPAQVALQHEIMAVMDRAAFTAGYCQVADKRLR